MQTLLLLALAIGSLATPTASVQSDGVPGHSSDPDKVIIDQMQKVYMTNTRPLLTGSCSNKTVRVRKSWSALCKQERLDYLRAVNCLASKPNRADRSEIPGARTRRDDFVYSHLNQTNFIHNSGLLLPWHRQFVWAYEEALRNECGYTGSQPYWDWSEHSDDQLRSPVFDGSETSFGSNGQYVPHGEVSGIIPGILINGTTPLTVTRDPGTGGGCVTDGYFGKFTVNLGPACPANNTVDNLYGTQYNPRCLKRDIDNRVSQQYLNYTVVADLLQSPDIHTFRPSIDFNLHPASHRLGGGDIFDLFTSPNDPVFFLLHANHDRLWTIWQGQDYASRRDALDGTVTFLNTPPSPNATLETTMKMLFAGGDIPIRDAMSAVSGKYCYVYE